MTFDREPDLDNANVGMPDTRKFRRNRVFYGKLPARRLLFLSFRRCFMVKINSEELDAAGRTLAECLASAGYDPKRIAVERNGEIVPRAQYAETVLQNGDCVEIVRFVGGG